MRLEELRSKKHDVDVASEKGTARYFPLHALQEQYGDIYGASEQTAVIAKGMLPRDQGVVKAASSLTGTDKQRVRDKKPTQTIAKPKAADVIKGFEPYRMDCLGEVSRHDRSYSQIKQESIMHHEFLASLDELNCLGTELDLSFKAVKSASSSGPRRPAPTEGTSSSRRTEADEIILDVELQKFGSAYNVVFRAPQSWEIHQPGATKRQQKIWGARPKMIHSTGGWVTTEPSRLCPPVTQTVGDSNHIMSVELSERMPEMITLKRSAPSVRPGSAVKENSGRKSPEGISVTTSLALATLPTPRTAVVEFGGENAPLTGKSDDLEAQCRSLERDLLKKVSAHYEALPDELHLPSPPAHMHGPTATAQYAAELVAAATRMRARAKDLSKEYLREIRSALRLVSSELPSISRIIEGAVKGLVVAIDMSLSAGWQQAERLEHHSHKLEEEMEASRMLLAQVHDLERENAELKETLKNSGQKYHEESQQLHKKIDILKQEIEKLSPDQSDVDGVAGLMGEYGTLMQELLDESYKQTFIMDRITTYTQNVVSDAKTENRQRTEHGRVIELMNGELLLRPHDVFENETQCTDLDLHIVNAEAPIRLRLPRIRQLLTAFKHENTEETTIEELDADIDKIYNAKMKADQDADSAGFPRSELADFVVEYYLEILRSVEKAQTKFCSILRCLQSSDHSTEEKPLKVALFQRFLEFCEYKESIPLSVFNLVMQAKRYATAQLLKVRPNAREASKPRARSKAESQAGASILDSAESLDEPQLGVATAYEAALKALPAGRIPAMRELFIELANRAEIDEADLRRPLERDFLVLLHLLHERLHGEGSPQLLTLIQRVEGRGSVSAEEFRDAVRDSKVQAVDDAVWRPKLSDPHSPGMLDTEMLMEYLGGGSQGRLPSATISESAFMAAVTHAVCADYDDRMKGLQSLWQRQTIGTGHDSLTYEEFSSVVLSEEPSMPAPMLRTLFLTAVDLSRSCSQLNGDPCLPAGTQESVREEYGGDVVTFPLFAKAALRCGLFLKDFSTVDSAAGEAKPGAGAAQSGGRSGSKFADSLGKRGGTTPSSKKR